VRSSSLRAFILGLGAVVALLTACTGRDLPPYASPSTSADARAANVPNNGYAVGQVVDDATGKPIVGALVVISSYAYPGASLPRTARAQRAPHAVTDASGKFKITGMSQSQIPDWSWKYVIPSATPVPFPQWVEVFLPRGDPHATYHGFERIIYNHANDLGTIALTSPTNEEKQWKRRVEYDRSHLGVPAVTIPLVFDDLTLKAGRRWATYMAVNNWYNHPCPPPGTGYKPCVLTWAWEINNHGMPSAENIDINANWRGAETAFMSERANCPKRNWKTCPWSETTGHYINIMSATNWIGLGIATGSNKANEGVPYFDMEFTGPVTSGFPDSVRGYAKFLKVHPDWK
jgi:hypothetical protein